MNANEVEDLSKDSVEDKSPSINTDADALLATAMNLATDNDIVWDYIENTINAASVP